MFEIIIFTAHCPLFINRKFLTNVRNFKFSEHGKMLTFAGDGENFSKMQQKFFTKTIYKDVKVKDVWKNGKWCEN
jgi:hypothetical protein